ncbi:sodium/glutamate symporter [Anaerococcus sp. AGMB09787]|uniref:sodium/glutamate symporter n=1 Tax=Anaerococcus sp. AGMB09787 TaxID=2922869 RepID=UPI001FAFAB5E|nr:sodium/glutamate symporter [Anaerococcus sp. AGMB09787]
MEIDLIQTLSIAMLALAFGSLIKSKFEFFRRFFIPSPVIGGLVISILVFILKKFFNLDINFDLSLQDFFMNVFFTAIGLAASFKSLKRTGLLGLKLSLVIIVLLPLQNIIGVGLASIMGINPLHGIAMGSTSMTGGIGSAISFGKVMEDMGAANNTSIGIAAATFGLLVGSLVGGPVANRLIKKNKLTSKESISRLDLEEKSIHLDQKSLTGGVIIIALAALLGTLINKILSLSKLNFPYYVGLQFGGLILRNIYDLLNKDIGIDAIDTLGNISLNIFLSLALISLDLIAIASLALPMFIILISQAIFIAIYTTLVTYRFLGKDYDSAVMAAGHCGVGLGQTPNAMANMKAIIEENGPSDIAMFIFPIVLAISVNLANPIVISFFINILG